MKLNANLVPEAVLISDINDRQTALECLARLFADSYGMDYHKVLEALEEREALGSTGFGREVAIPHARVEGLSRPSAAVIRPTNPIDFDSADGRPVRLVIGLLSPESAGATHLQALAAISRMVRDEDMRSGLLNASDADAIFGMITNAVERDAA